MIAWQQCWKLILAQHGLLHSGIENSIHKNTLKFKLIQLPCPRIEISFHMVIGWPHLILTTVRSECVLLFFLQSTGDFTLSQMTEVQEKLHERHYEAFVNAKCYFFLIKVSFENFLTYIAKLPGDKVKRCMICQSVIKYYS